MSLPRALNVFASSPGVFVWHKTARMQAMFVVRAKTPDINRRALLLLDDMSLRDHAGVLRGHTIHVY